MCSSYCCYASFIFRSACCYPFVWLTLLISRYACEQLKNAEEDYERFDAIFTNNLNFTRNIHEEVKEWVASNIDQWMETYPDWFSIKAVDDYFLPIAVFEAEGGEKRASDLRERCTCARAMCARIAVAALLVACEIRDPP